MSASAAAIASPSTGESGEYSEVGGIYREVVPNEQLVFSWAWHSTPERESLVTVSIRPDGAGTLMVFPTSSSSIKPRATTTSAAGANCSHSWKAFSADHGRSPCNRTRSSRARNGSPPARRIWRTRRSSPRRATGSTEERRALPWVKVDKDYVFDGPGGKVGLADLFKGTPQLVVQHFMFAPDWDAGCKSCSFWADGFERMIPHLAARDTTLVAVSRAPLEKLEAFKQRMGWTFDWYSSAERLQL